MNSCFKFYAQYYAVFGLFGLFCYHVAFITKNTHVNMKSASISQISLTDAEIRRKLQERFLHKIDSIIHYANGSTDHYYPEERNTSYLDLAKAKKKYAPSKNYRKMNKQGKRKRKEKDVLPTDKNIYPEILNPVVLGEKMDTSKIKNTGEHSADSSILSSKLKSDLMDKKLFSSCFSIFYPWKITEEQFTDTFAERATLSRGEENDGSIIEVVYSGDMGNNLFQASLGLILGSLLQYQVKMESINGFPATYDRNLISTARCRDWIEITEHNSRKYCESFHEIFEKIYSATNEENSGHCIRITDGYFQRYALYQPFLQYMRENMQVDSSALESLVLPKAEDVVVHIRYWYPYPLERVHISTPQKVKNDPFYPALDWEYYEKTISFFDKNLCQGSYSGDKHRNCGKLFVVCDKEFRSSPLVRKLEEEKHAIIHSSTALKDFEFIRRATNVIMPVSTFSWWAVLLSENIENKIVHYPLAGIFHPENLMITNSDANIPEDAELMKIQNPLDPKYELWGSAIPGSITFLPEDKQTTSVKQRHNFNVKYIFHDLIHRQWFGSFQEEVNSFVYEGLEVNFGKSHKSKK